MPRSQSRAALALWAAVAACLVGRAQETPPAPPLDPVPIAAPAPLGPDVRAAPSRLTAFWEKLRRLPALELTLQGRWVLASRAEVAWQLELHPRPDGGLTLALRAAGAGLDLAARLVLDAQRQPVTWELTKLRADLPAWWPAVAPHVSAEASEIVLTGRIELSGAGTWDEGRPHGPVRGGWQGGSVTWADAQVACDDVSAIIEVSDIGAQVVAPTQILRFRTGQVSQVRLTEGELTLGWDQQAVVIAQVRVRAFAGEFTAGPIRVPFGPGDVIVPAQAHAIALAELQPFLPPVIAAATGLLDGELTIRWGEADLELLRAQLGLPPGTTAAVRLGATPGVLSEALPAMILKFYDGVRGVEAGRIPLLLRRLDVVLTPFGDLEGRSGVIWLAGEAADPQLTAPIELQLNLRGPLGDLVRSGVSGWRRFSPTIEMGRPE